MNLWVEGVDPCFFSHRRWPGPPASNWLMASGNPCSSPASTSRPAAKVARVARRWSPVACMAKPFTWAAASLRPASPHARAWSMATWCSLVKIRKKIDWWGKNPAKLRNKVKQNQGDIPTNMQLEGTFIAHFMGPGTISFLRIHNSLAFWSTPHIISTYFNVRPQGVQHPKGPKGLAQGAQQLSKIFQHHFGTAITTASGTSPFSPGPISMLWRSVRRAIMARRWCRSARREEPPPGVSWIWGGASYQPSSNFWFVCQKVAGVTWIQQIILVDVLFHGGSLVWTHAYIPKFWRFAKGWGQPLVACVAVNAAFGSCPKRSSHWKSQQALEIGHQKRMPNCPTDSCEPTISIIMRTKIEPVADVSLCCQVMIPQNRETWRNMTFYDTV